MAMRGVVMGRGRVWSQCRLCRHCIGGLHVSMRRTHVAHQHGGRSEPLHRQRSHQQPGEHEAQTNHGGEILRVAPLARGGRYDTHPMSTFSQSFYTALQLLVALDPALIAIVVRSLGVSASACAIACAIGLPLGAWLGVARFRGHAGVLALLNTFLAVPSVVVGLLVYLLLSRSGPLGFLGWLFSFKAMVLAQALLVLPIVMALTRQVVADVESAHGEQLRSLGAGAVLRSLLLAWDERHALLTVVMACFGRAISEVGAVMIVGGNIDGFTRVMTTAIALETSKGDLPLALGLGLVLLAVVLLLNGLIGALRHWRGLGSGTAVVVAVGVAR